MRLTKHSNKRLRAKPLRFYRVDLYDPQEADWNPVEAIESRTPEKARALMQELYLKRDSSVVRVVRLAHEGGAVVEVVDGLGEVLPRYSRHGSEMRQYTKNRAEEPAE